MLRVFFLISLEGFRFIVRGLASGHLVIACLDFAFIAASGGASYREGQASLERNREFHAVKLKYVFQGIPRGIRLKKGPRVEIKTHFVRASINN
jgi:hypothetical protein